MNEVLAGLTLATCAVLLARLLMSEPRRYRFDAALRRFWHALRRRALLLWHWRATRRSAARAAQEAIRRARQKDDGEWDGNVYKPKSFRKPPDKNLH